ncbi:probable LRR receptor-like serine/threonine-protein kinase At1g07560 [Hibiscus syriacus]|uniref:probable LRR receptor-like serine/threonine-protein kinase At1g07560 n=1 Tax=Hibiscus syriacus TaxID=106335 RepID=UPI0019222BD2|nr:probable LRR receptor-like serine/threonine-protein kinase At1g07560 [Hibiscus syriacus]
MEEEEKMSSAAATAAKPVSFTSKSIQQMVSFIRQEAEERANEISISVDVTTVPFCFFAVRKKRGLAKGIKSAIPRVQTNNVPTRWSLAEIKSATMGFYKSRIIGKGGSAVVYKGYVPSAETVVVKRFDQFNGKAFTRNLFNTEFAIMDG